jgi:hypothetical protein
MCNRDIIGSGGVMIRYTGAGTVFIAKGIVRERRRRRRYVFRVNPVGRGGGVWRHLSGLEKLDKVEMVWSGKLLCGYAIKKPPGISTRRFKQLYFPTF